MPERYNKEQRRFLREHRRLVLEVLRKKHPSLVAILRSEVLAGCSDTLLCAAACYPGDLSGGAFLVFARTQIESRLAEIITPERVREAETAERRQKLLYLADCYLTKVQRVAYERIILNDEPAPEVASELGVGTQAVWAAARKAMDNMFKHANRRGKQRGPRVAANDKYTAYRHRKLSKKLCPRCGKKPSKKFVLCNECRKKHSAKMKAYRARNGLSVGGYNTKLSPAATDKKRALGSRKDTYRERVCRN